MTYRPDRDRDERGRARNSRPRDQLGRPLPRDQIGVAPLPEPHVLNPSQTLTTAQDLLDIGWPFQAHEVLEAAWKSAAETERMLWQGLAQLAVAVTHAARGNRRGATMLLERGRTAIKPYTENTPHAIDVPGLLAWASSCLTQIASPNAGPIDLRAPRLLLADPDEQPT